MSSDGEPATEKVAPDPEPNEVPTSRPDQSVASVEPAVGLSPSLNANADALTPLEFALLRTDDIDLRELKPDATATPEPHVAVASSSATKKARNASSAAFFRVLLWIVLLALHIFCAAFYGSGTYVYHNLPNTQLSIQMASYKLTINPKYFPIIVAFHGVFSACHLVCFIEMILRSVLARELVFHRTQKIKRAVVHSADGRRKSILADKLNQLRTGSIATLTRMSLDTNSTSSLKIKSFARRATIVWDNSFGHAGVFGIGGKYFTIIFMVRELVECTLQSIQAAQMSNNVPRVWFNRFVVLVVAINCWTTPVVQHLFKHNPRLELMLCLLFDVILDAISSVGVTTILAAKYLPDYDPAATNFSIVKCWSVDIWYAFMITEFRQLFVQSWFDFATRFLFALTTILCMDDVKMLAAAAESVVVRHEGGASETRLQLWNRRVEKVFHVFMVSWGFIIIGLHADASITSSVPGCVVMLNPWVKSKPACSCMNINCMARETPIMGTAAEIDAIWAPIEPKRLMVLTIVACPALHMPHSLQSFYGLSALNIVVSGIREWGEEAALTQTHHPNMHHLAFMHNNLSAYGNGSTLPPGIVNPDFPKYLLDMFFGANGLSDLPDNLDTIWPKRGMNFLVPNNQFETVPDVVMRMELGRLNMDFNMIQVLPAELFELKSLRWLDVAHNPLTTFPTDVTPSSALSVFNFALTNVTTLPDWMTSSAYLKQTILYGAQTPLCVDNSAGSAIQSHLNCQVPPVLIIPKAILDIRVG